MFSFSWMVVYNTESACVFRDFLTYFLSFAGFFFLFSEVALLEHGTETREEIFILAPRKLLARFL